MGFPWHSGARSTSLCRSSSRVASLIGAVVFAGVAEQAWAQPLSQMLQNRPAVIAPDDGLGPRDLMLEADSLVDDRDHDTVTAEGHVQARLQGRTLRADRVVYNTVTGAAHAQGHAVVLNVDGTSEFGQDIVLDDQFRAAVAYGFALREQANITIVAGAAIRRNEAVTQLSNAIYTACNICAQDGSPKSPTWSIQASRIVQDRDHHVIYYRNAVIRILGFPVFYAPVFWHPDPTSPRRSGLLAPKIEYSKRRGFSYEQPYLWTVTPSVDLIVSPQINSRVAPLLNVDYTQRFYSGLVDIRAGYTYEENFDNHTKFGSDTSRSYVLGRGLFNLSPQWVAGFGLERVTDPTFLRRYSVPDVYTDRGPYPADTDRLISQVFTNRQDQQSYISIAAMTFESLRAYTETTSEGDKLFPVVGPLIEARYNPTEPVFGGRLEAVASAVSLTRGTPVISVIDPVTSVPAGALLFTAPTPGVLDTYTILSALAEHRQISSVTYTDSRRASIDADWRRTFTLDMGLRVEPFADVRGDLFSVSDSTVFDGATGTTKPGAGTITRGLGTIGANLSMPFVRPIGTASLVLEPMAQIALSPNLRVNPNIPNEDSVAFEYDETNLFSINRFSGYDLVESGQRINVGGRATLDWGGGHNASVTLGRTFRAEPDPAFNLASGLNKTASDWVAAASFAPVNGLSFFTRARLDADTLAVHRNETGLDFGVPRFFGSIRYDRNDAGYFVTSTGQVSVGHTQDADVSGTLFFTRHWGVWANVQRDLQQNLFPISQLALVYQDECIRLDLVYTHDQTYGSVIGTSDSITFRLTLATLGGTSSTPGSRAGGR